MKPDLEKASLDNSPVRSGSFDQSHRARATRGPEFLAKLRDLEGRLDAKLGVESEAIERKLPDERKPVKWHETATMFCLWASGTMNLSCFATGFLGYEFGLSMRQAILMTVFGTLLGGAVSGFAATFGARTGLRQISISRYAFGWWPNKVIAALNTITQLGWAAVACITGGLALTAAADGGLSLLVGIVILACASCLISFFGLRAILVWERYAWLVYLVVFLVIIGETSKYSDNSDQSKVSGIDLSGQLLTLIAITYGSSASWQSMASDYYAHYPVDTNRFKVFILTALGISVPTSMGMITGIVVAYGLNNQPVWSDVYEHQGIGYLIQTALYPYGFAKFILVLFVFSGMNNIVISVYSGAISCQQFARPFSWIPRFIWVILCLAVILALGLGGREQLNAFLQNFLSLLGYWSTQYFVILFSEHVFIRRMNFDNYDLEGWNDPSRLPIGIAAGIAFSVGICAWVLGMSQTWYVGPISSKIGSGGGDVANQLTLVVTFVVFVPLRILEKKYIGR